MSLPAIGDTWELDGFQFNAGEFGDRGFSAVASVSGWDDSLPPRPQLTPRPNGPGAYRGANYRGPMVVGIKGLAKAPSRVDREDLVAALRALCPDAQTLYPLTNVNSARTLTAFVELADTAHVTRLPDGLHVTFDIQAVAVDGRKYSTELQSAQAMLAQAGAEGVYWNGPAGSTGVEWNGPAGTTGTVYQATSSTSSVIALDNDGFAPTPILFTITAPTTGTMSTPTITNNDTGEVIAYSGTLRTGDVLIINTGTGLALLNGVPVRGLFSRFEPFEVPARSSIAVQFSAGGPADTATLLAQWSDAY